MTNPPFDDPGPGSGWDGLESLILIAIIVVIVLWAIAWAVGW